MSVLAASAQLKHPYGYASKNEPKTPIIPVAQPKSSYCSPSRTRPALFRGCDLCASVCILWES